MGKLLQLLNEYSPLKDTSEYSDKYWKVWIRTRLYAEPDVYENYTLQIISKKFWFIQWLVGTDKIDYGAWHNVFVNSNYFDNIAGLREYEVLTMYLSIQDEPIEFLISILK